MPKSLKFAPNLSRPAGGVRIERFPGDLPQEDLDSDSLRLGLSELNTRERLKDGDRAKYRNETVPFEPFDLLHRKVVRRESNRLKR